MPVPAPADLEDVELGRAGSPGVRAHAAAGLMRLRTDHGELLVAVQGDRARPAILTYHDVGLDYTSFQSFFEFAGMRALLQSFCVLHVVAPGQEPGAPPLPPGFVYPNLDQLAEQLRGALTQLGVRSCVALGAGAGGAVLARLALAHPEQVEALALVNCPGGAAGWLEWGYWKVHVRTLRTRGMTPAVIDYLMWHHYGRDLEERNPDLAATYRAQVSHGPPAVNLAAFAEAAARRGPLPLARGGSTLRVPVLNVAGALSPRVDDTVALHARLDPACSTWMKIGDCGMVVEEAPGKLAEAFLLFLQGEGCGARVAPRAPPPRAQSARLSRPPPAPAPSPLIRITENPLPETVVC